MKIRIFLSLFVTSNGITSSQLEAPSTLAVFFNFKRYIYKIQAIHIIVTVGIPKDLKNMK